MPSPTTASESRTKKLSHIRRRSRRSSIKEDALQSAVVGVAYNPSGDDNLTTNETNHKQSRRRSLSELAASISKKSSHSSQHPNSGGVKNRILRRSKTHSESESLTLETQTNSEGTPPDSSSKESTKSQSQQSQQQQQQPHRKQQPLEQKVEKKRKVVNFSSQAETEDELTCAICLDLLRRPTVLPCHHTFCLVCLQNYVSSYRTTFLCPNCRLEVAVPEEGVSGLPINSQFQELIKSFQKTRSKSNSCCTQCGGSATAASKCRHCQKGFCSSCMELHTADVFEDVKKLRSELEIAMTALSLRSESTKERFERVEERLSAAVEERVARLRQEQDQLKVKLQEALQQEKTLTQQIASDIKKTLDRENSSSTQNGDNAYSQYAELMKLLRLSSTGRSPRVTFDDETLTLNIEDQMNIPDPAEPPEEEVKEEDDEDKIISPEDHSLFYRSKGSHSRLRWGQHLGERPAGVAVCPWTNEVYVTGTDTCRIYIFDMTGRQIGSFGSRGHNDGQFLCPFGIAFSYVSREILVTDKWKNCIQVFDASGDFVRQLGRKGKGRGHFSSPEGIATDRNGRIYVADTCNDRVQVLDSDGVFLQELGVSAADISVDGKRYFKSELNEPTGVAASPDGSKVFVADSGNHRIKVYSGSGARLLTFGSKGRNKGQFCNPECISVDSEGFILVGDSGNGRVQIFRPNGNFIRYLGTRGSWIAGEFSWVSGVTISRGFDVVVTDFKNHAVAIF